MTRATVEQKLGEYYSRKMNGKVWSVYDTHKRAYAIRGENLPAHPDMQAQYPNGWSMLDYVKPTVARQLITDSEPCGTSHDAGVLRDVLGDI